MKAVVPSSQETNQGKPSEADSGHDQPSGSPMPFVKGSARQEAGNVTGKAANRSQAELDAIEAGRRLRVEQRLVGQLGMKIRNTVRNSTTYHQAKGYVLTPRMLADELRRIATLAESGVLSVAETPRVRSRA